MEIQQYSTIHISIPKIKISHFQRNAFIYQIDVVTRWSKWHLQKKFQQFKDLHQILFKEFNDLPEFPTNYHALFRGQSEQAAEQNKQMLQNYLRITSLRKDIINCEQYSEFLQIQKHAPLMLAHRPKFLAQFQIQQRINDQGKVIQDFYYNEQYIVFATGNNSPLQKFNSLIANTKFPWQQDEDIEFILPLGTVQCWIKKKDAFKFKRIWTRNYPVQVKKLIFNPQNEVMIVGLNDGGIQIFRLMKKGRNTYYEVRKLITVHQDTISGMHLDVVNSILYSSSVDGWLNIIDVKKAAVIDTIEFHAQIYGIYGDSDNNRLFVSLGDGNIEIYEYDFKAKLRYRHTICTPQTGPMSVMNFDPVKNYFFVGCTQSGKILIFEIGKLGHQKITKQVGTLQSKKGIKDLIWNRQKMQLINCTQTGQIFFWDTVKGKQTFMLKVFQGQNLSKTVYIKQDNILITSSQGRKIKFWQVPKSWRDITAENQQQKQIQIRRKVQNLYRTREAIKRKQRDSSDDDLRGWHLDSQESQGSEQGGIIDFLQQKLEELT